MTGLFSKPKIPKPKPATRMPDPEDPAMKQDQMRQMMLARQRSGRASTILSSGSGDYSGSTLGIN